ncbi:hypothetical protein GCM10007932_23100 [Vibrio penaeicida]|uniref:Uncharacterized protein n=1 Tax=Vibrio penaeicida TaxID=104609 RepID=A0AAV5NR85_9VIBR|nr:hypothetical protein GCM10007932_23100 [Vibrio penaeicida]
MKADGGLINRYQYTHDLILRKLSYDYQNYKHDSSIYISQGFDSILGGEK